MPRRRLTDDERELWQRVARSARRLSLSGELPDEPSPPATAPDPRAPFSDPPAPPAKGKGEAPPRTLPIPPAALSGRASPPPVRLDLAETVSERLAREPVRMDRNLHRSMTRGKLDPESRIDLHGMTVAEAHSALNGFLISAHARGLRLVLVITGKGRKPGPDHFAPMPARAGILKHEVPHWLRLPPLNALVMEVREAHRSHGGTGAYYIYLRKRR
ncbi:Smr/MutS family protein [Pararhodobacter sp.]|uniref:Smr/MutS family protein n=1 Tax=Pararhodobacter sp. TaxID=2127056 RepID=UPI002AFFC864|nr:Smr/MutS family protein [Pararhodobacter sp.]